MNPDDECEFCEIVASEEPARIVLRSNEVVAFFPLEPATLGHTLLIPTSHIPDIWALDESAASSLAVATLSVAHAVRTAMSPDGLNIIQSNGEAATQTVPHLHVHVVPRWFDDDMGDIWPEKTDWSSEQKDEAQQAIRDALRDDA
ncbi:HIT family hydrolase, diadenosine tetraphosphate hydrolase [Mycolicibacterium rhodesiae NBB3]|uniref:HIT family hydrolase, diadenosine tetraphosphate hydrolase n=1 Tax=Mycolicibacterium rhodesiae (strain NBB3) TaxID=710685 RepID=G8RWL8_MYCRN|nr:HIT domain-containing protein [Mycolicibacterium rhodesiae]AEV74326.1 HIT family hydrolase, diadenosine tetraphosphate hydrolase [Mycolicibacterium rhodesiae NBB3]